MDYPYIVIGAGAGGLVVSIGLAKAGKKVLLVEMGHYGGDCTNYGCVPSKALIASAHAAHKIHTAHEYGIELNGNGFNAMKSLDRTRGIVKHIRDHEEPEVLEKMGVETMTGQATFIDPHTLKILGKEVTGDTIVIAAGSSPFIPPIAGLDNVPYLTNETIFDLEEIPPSLAVLGGGPIGCELGQAFHRLGSEVTIIQKPPDLLMRDELEARRAMEKCFRNEGINLCLGREAKEVTKTNDGVEIHVDDGTSIHASHFLISTGRKPNLSTLDLNAAGIKHTKRGITVDAYGRTNHKHIWAVGDITGRALFTHVAENEGRSVLTNLLLPSIFRIKEDLKQPVPHVTYTDPEVATVGMSEEAAIEKYGSKKIAVYLVPLDQVDRAITTGETEGFVKVVTKKWSSHILGACIVAPRAGEMLMEISLAISAKIPLRKLAKLIHPYPTFGLGIRKAADQWLTKTIIPIFLKK